MWRCSGWGALVQWRALPQHRAEAELGGQAARARLPGGRAAGPPARRCGGAEGDRAESAGSWHACPTHHVTGGSSAATCKCRSKGCCRLAPYDFRVGERNKGAVNLTILACGPGQPQTLGSTGS